MIQTPEPRDARSTACRTIAAHALVLAGYLLLTLLLTWPLVRDFRTYVTGEVIADMRHAIWVTWYTMQAALGQAPWPWTRSLHAPFGINLLVDGVGPINALFTLPFWPWGAAAAYNGAALAGFTLSGWSQYLLARHVTRDAAVAFFAGALFLAWPIHVAGLYGHLEKLFVGFLPLSVLATLLALDTRRRHAIALAPAAALLATLLHNGNQFMFAAFAIALVTIDRLLFAPAADRPAVLRRAIVTALVVLAVNGPVLLLVLGAMRHPWLPVNYGGFSPFYSPDLLQLLVPGSHQWIGGWNYPSLTPLGDFVWATTIPALAPTWRWYGSGIETAVAIPIVAIVLSAVAWRRASRETWFWLLFAGVFTMLALGPWLRVAGLGREDLHVPLPYAVMRRVPGLDVMRTPGRFMMIASVGFSIAAALGLRTLAGPGRRRRTVLLAGATTLALVECWPRPWTQTVLPPVPQFYQQLADDRGDFRVLDLPHGWLGRSDRASAYLYYQTVHRKPILWCYLSRSYTRFPMRGFDSLWTGDVSDVAALRARLRALHYRYVVWHKHGDELFAAGRVARVNDGPPRGQPVGAATDPFIRAAFASDRPIVDDDLVTVYLVDPR